MSKTDIAALTRRLDEVKKEIAAKAGQDASFRSNLLSDTNSTIEAEYGLPPGALSKLSIKVVEEGPNTIVVPIPPNRSSMELTDEQLEAVAGGLAFSVAVTGAVIGGVITAGGFTAGYGVSRGW
jgi:hypothetical protein